MSRALARAEQFLRVGPYILWFGIHIMVALIIKYYRDYGEMIYYLIAFFLFATLVIWLFGFYVFPQYLAKEGKINRRLGLLIALNILVFVCGLLVHTSISEVFDLSHLKKGYSPTAVRVALWILMVMLGMVYMASIRVARVYYERNLQKMEYKAERAEAELKLLKGQISPHFLFNTLNNIYGLAYLGDKKAAEMISRLSKLLRYLLYDCEQERVPLVKEKELIEHYLSIQLLKHEEPLNVDFYHAGVVLQHMIAPMILINFIENCFKHSDLESNPQGWIKISMEVENNELHFRTENTRKGVIEELPVDRKGIGLTNSLKLLEANYPKEHEIEITKQKDLYVLDLKLKL